MTLIPPYTFKCEDCGEISMSSNPLGDIICFQCEEKYRNNFINNINKITDYLKTEVSEGKREFRIQFHDDKKFIIHPLGKDGKTLDHTL